MGATGATGAQGPQGPAGAAANFGAVVVISVTEESTDLDPGDSITDTATCTGTTPRRIGGGVSVSDDSGPVIVDSFPSGGTTPGTSWTGTASSYSTNQSVTLTVYAICAP